MNARRYSLAGAILVAACAAETPDSASTSGRSSGGAAVPLTRFRDDSLPFSPVSGFSAETTLVIRDAATWAQAWSMANGALQPEPPLPSVDFGQEVVVLAALGSRGSGGYAILLTGATVDGSDVTVTVRQTSPGPACMTTQSLTQPVDLARLPRTDAAVRFDVTQVVQDCAP